MTTLGRNLRAMRKARGLSQPKLAERSGVAQPTISDVERGVREPHYSTLRKLADALNVEVLVLFEEDAPPKSPLTELEPEDFDELRREARDDERDGATLLAEMQAEYDALDAHHRRLREEGGTETEIEEATRLLVEARKRWRVLMFARVEETMDLDERRDPTAPERPDTRFLSLEEADAQIMAARQRAKA